MGAGGKDHSMRRAHDQVVLLGSSNYKVLELLQLNCDKVPPPYNTVGWGWSNSKTSSRCQAQGDNTQVMRWWSTCFRCRRSNFQVLPLNISNCNQGMTCACYPFSPLSHHLMRFLIVSSRNYKFGSGWMELDTLFGAFNSRRCGRTFCNVSWGTKILLVLSMLC